MKQIISLNFLIFIFIMIFLIKIPKCFAVGVTANATVSVIQVLAITKTQDLGFGVAAPGDVAKVVLPADTTAAIFKVTGQASQPYTITLPTTINMTRTGGTETIAVNTFTSTPATTGTLSASGSQTLRVGATRAAVPVGQVLGNYTGTFTVTVIY